ncbi:MAG: DUF3047 domain-containing protein [Candidatus Phaeomarinobacter sp.]
MGVAHDLGVAFKRWRYVAKHGKAEAPLSGDDFRDQAQPLIDAAADQIAEAAFIDLPPSRMPWTSTDIVLEDGDEVTLLSVGRLWLSRGLDIWVGPQFQVWGRVGETGNVFNGTRESMTVKASDTGATGGRLYLGGQFPGQFSEKTGRMMPDLNAYEGADGEFTVLAIRWRTSAADGLAAMAAAGPEAGDVNGLVAKETARLAAPDTPPEGWNHLWFLGQNNIYTEQLGDGDGGGHACIHCHTDQNVGILQKETPFELTPETEISWDWKVDAIPSALPEDTAASHDYISIAVEFENGRDITYYWSKDMPVGKAYWCPLPTWKDREFHVVVRSGEGDLKKWLSETRNLYTDYMQYMGEPPERVVRVWFIANSLFQRIPGTADFRNIQLVNDCDTLRVL